MERAMSEMMVQVNSQPTKIPEHASLKDVLTQFGINEETPGIAVALNTQVVPREHWPRAALKERDDIVIVTATQGG